MNVMTIRKLSDEVKHGLRLRAAENGHSMEEEARQILASAIVPAARSESGQAAKPKNFLLALRELIPPEARCELELPSRASNRPVPFSD